MLREGVGRGLIEGKLSALCLWVLALAVIGSRGLFVLATPNGTAGAGLTPCKLWEGRPHHVRRVCRRLDRGPGFVRRHGLPVGQVFDAFSPAIALGFGLTRIGCFLNACCFGQPCDLPWGVEFGPDTSPGSDLSRDGISIPPSSTCRRPGSPTSASCSFLGGGPASRTALLRLSASRIGEPLRDRLLPPLRGGRGSRSSLPGMQLSLTQVVCLGLFVGVAGLAAGARRPAPVRVSSGARDVIALAHRGRSSGRHPPGWSGSSAIPSRIAFPRRFRTRPSPRRARLGLRRVRRGGLRIWRRSLAGARALGLRGLNVTAPHKVAAAGAGVAGGSIGAAAELGPSTPSSSKRGRRDGRGIRPTARVFSCLRRREAFDVVSRDYRLVLGAGGAGASIAHALLGRGAKVTLANRDPVRRMRTRVARLSAAPPGRPGPGEAAGARPGRFPAQRRLGGEAGLLVGCVVGGIGLPEGIDLGGLSGNRRWSPISATTRPLPPLVGGARARGLRAWNGLGMLVHQGASSFTLWTGIPAPLAAMARAAGYAVRREVACNFRADPLDLARSPGISSAHRPLLDRSPLPRTCAGCRISCHYGQEPLCRLASWRPSFL